MRSHGDEGLSVGPFSSGGTARAKSYFEEGFFSEKTSPVFSDGFIHAPTPETVHPVQSKASGSRTTDFTKLAGYRTMNLGVGSTAS